ncbi:glycosyltransferase family 9 protein [Sphaerotilus sulfidivorans]|jgi:heptosyltransferase-2|uniref:glycosyltransferase family 9 protein n=1 Tax=Sphaerotilus sp. FB-3 TaxID=2913396 RepID=UPI0020409369|nr:glycosyltransferase family 9 protein [Sphaerotilus sp. FB-3]GKQ56513.1 hypothetical protein QMTAC487_03710 [Sphaerotilus sp. FB-3]
MRLLRPLADATNLQPLSAPVPADDAAFRARKGEFKLALRTMRRALQLSMSGQRRRLCTRIDPAQRRILWIHQGMPQVGDALMDLAPRSLLAEQGYMVDLYAVPHLVALFRDDPWFSRTLSDPAEVDPARYDLAIVLGHDRKALELKQTRLPQLPWVSLHGYYDSPGFHRARYVAQRLADLLGIVLDTDAMARHSVQKLATLSANAAWATAQCPQPADAVIAVGGVSPDRTYFHWDRVVAGLHADGMRRIILIGSDNGRAMADRITALATTLPGLELIDCVARTTLPQAHALVGRARIALCADGGLMHLALATSTPVIGLYCGAIRPEWREPLRHAGCSLVAPQHDTSTIDPAEILCAARMLPSPVSAHFTE